MGWNVALAGLQAGLAVTALAAINLAPPQSGPILLLSATGMQQGQLLNLAMGAGALPLGPGPLPGSILVRGERRALALAALPAGVLVLAGSNRLCGRPS
jgi:hypothetical protein